MLSEADFSDETLFLAFDANNVGTFNFEMSNTLDDLNLDSLNLPDEILQDPIIDTSDSDSGISNHGEKHVFLCDIEQGSWDAPSLPSPATTSFIPSTTVDENMTDSDPFISMSCSPPQIKRPRPQEPLITSVANFDSTSNRSTTASSIGLTPSLPLETGPLKLEPRGSAAIIRQVPASQTKKNHNSDRTSKIPCVLSRGQNNSNSILASSNSAFSQPAQVYYTTTNVNTSELDESLDQQHLIPAVVSLPVIDEFTFSNSFQVVSPSTESESIEKLVKKQERMIKNRQAACLSRLRKKEYLERLELRLDQLRQENAHLRQENNEWRNRYDILEKSLGDLQAEYASLRRASQSGMSTNRDEDSSGSPSNHSPPIISIAADSTNTSPHRFAHVLPLSSKQQPLFPSSLTPPRCGITSKITLLRKQSAERIAHQKSPSTGPIPGNSANSRIFTSDRGSVALPRGVRKKVTTSLFILACMFIVNFSVTPFGQLSSSLGASFGGAQNIVATAFESERLMLKPAVASRTLFSVPAASANTEITQPRKNSTPNVSNPSSVNTTTAVSEIVRCLPDEIFNLQNEPMWLVLDTEEDESELPLLERRKQMAHSRHVNSSGQPASELPPERHLVRGGLFSRIQRDMPKRAFLVRRPVKTDEAEWNEASMVNSSHFDHESSLSNLTVFLRNGSLSSREYAPATKCL
ncbi:hypothetical protein Aperf_G00000127966 [Anoplocephala perfoliata]